jgi:uncharacterized membrane protein YkvI
MDSFSSANVWQRYFVPGFTFMCVVIGGGYATGRELVQFFMPAGPLGGLLGMGVTAIVWSVIFALSLELARVTRSFEYRSFFRQLLGRGWIVFELTYLAILLLVLAVLGAASGEMVHAGLGIPVWCGTLALVALIAAIASFGSALIEALFSAWGLLLYATYAVFLLVSLAVFREAIRATVLGTHAIGAGWLQGGFAYAGYNLAVVPALLFCARHQTRRREALIAGALAGPIAIIPGMLFFLALLALYPQIRDSALPVQSLLAALDKPYLSLATQAILFGTLAKTGVGIVHGFNERLLAAMPAFPPRRARALRLTVPLLLSAVAILLATRIGLVSLIAQGYGHIAWVVIGIYALPLLTVGVWRIYGKRDVGGR